MTEIDPYSEIRKLERDLVELKLELARVGNTNALIRQKLDDITDDIQALRANLKSAMDSGEVRFVPLVRYLPVERVVYGLVAITLTTVVGALIGLVLTR